MPRTARIVVPGCFYHITQRGNNKMTVFCDDLDRRRYLYWFEESRSKYRVEIYAYCLMNNHVHFIARAGEQGFAGLFNSVQTRYAQYFNQRYQKYGHLWQGRYYSCILDDTHLFAAIRYVERNPVRAEFVTQAWDWAWSSARAHVHNEKGIIALSDFSKYMNIGDWKEYLDGGDTPNDLSSIRKETLSRRVWGSQEFVTTLEIKYGIRLSRPKMGRPKK